MLRGIDCRVSPTGFLAMTHATRVFAIYQVPLAPRNDMQRGGKTNIDYLSSGILNHKLPVLSFLTIQKQHGEKQMNKEETLRDKIVYELDMIRIMSKMSRNSINDDLEIISNDTDKSLCEKLKTIEYDNIEVIFEDIIKRCWKISEFLHEITTTAEKIA